MANQAMAFLGRPWPPWKGFIHTDKTMAIQRKPWSFLEGRGHPGRTWPSRDGHPGSASLPGWPREKAMVILGRSWTHSECHGQSEKGMIFLERPQARFGKQRLQDFLPSWRVARLFPDYSEVSFDIMLRTIAYSCFFREA